MSNLCKSGKHDLTLDNSRCYDNSCRLCKHARDKRYKLSKKARKSKGKMMLQVKRKIRILDFDIENRPLSYWTPIEPTSEITAIASCWADDPESMEVLLLGDIDLKEILERFVERYNQADMVTGHYIRKHDLPTISGALMELGLPQLKSKLTCDTRLDMHKKKGMPATQEYLSEILGLPIDKFKMGQAQWREANRLTPEGLEITLERVSTDVRQHMLLREAMLKKGLLSGPKMWNS